MERWFRCFPIMLGMHMQRAAKAFARLRLLVGDEVTDLVVRKPWMVPEMAHMETKRAGRIVPDGPTARAYVSSIIPVCQVTCYSLHLEQARHESESSGKTGTCHE